MRLAPAGYAHVALIALNVPVVLIFLYLFIYAFVGLWEPGVAAVWWWPTLLSLPVTIILLGMSRLFWQAGSRAASNVIALFPVIACAPIICRIAIILARA